MAELIYSGRSLAFAESESWFGMYAHENNDSNTVFALTKGETYTVIWDSRIYVCTGRAINSYGMTAVAIGNYGKLGVGEETGAPFIIGHITHIDDGTNSVDVNVNAFVAVDKAETHTVSVYAGELKAELLLSETTIDIGSNKFKTLDNPIELLSGETYTVIWDGEQYVCVAEAGAYSNVPMVEIGNGNLSGGEDDTEEPFCVMYTVDNQRTIVFPPSDNAAHTIAVYKGDFTSGGDSTEDGYLLKDAELAFELETNSETVYYNNEVAPAITVGNTYTVIWDGSYYDCTAKEYTEDSLTAVVLGNLNIQDNTAENTGEPFLYLYVNVGGNAAANFKTLETDASHVISLYDGVLKQPVPETVNLVLLDRNGNPVTYEGIKTVSFNTADGKIATFTLSAISS